MRSDFIRICQYDGYDVEQMKKAFLCHLCRFENHKIQYQVKQIHTFAKFFKLELNPNKGVKFRITDRNILCIAHNDNMITQVQIEVQPLWATENNFTVSRNQSNKHMTSQHIRNIRIRLGGHFEQKLRSSFR